ncbi:hypothetical protein [Nocardia sp. NPDC127526]|uniref:hypothetical protein n=1 Tax=Nocardia sp. NPDC127526 TaxID=3345393 RepID=UPI00362F4192
MSRSTLKVLAAVAISLAAGAGTASAAPGGMPLEPTPGAQAPVGAQPAPIVGVSPGSSSAESLVCLLHSISGGARFCL